MFKRIMAMLALLTSMNALAITEVTGQVARLYPTDNYVYFSLKNDQCGKGIDVYYFFELNSEVKKAWFAMLLAASATNKVVNVSLPNCPVNGSSVLVRYIYQNF